MNPEAERNPEKEMNRAVVDAGADVVGVVRAIGTKETAGRMRRCRANRQWPIRPMRGWTTIWDWILIR
jgi:hypothetical protein